MDSNSKTNFNKLLCGTGTYYRDLSNQVLENLSLPDLLKLGVLSKSCANDDIRKQIIEKKVTNGEYIKSLIENGNGKYVNDFIKKIPDVRLKNLACKSYFNIIKEISEKELEVLSYTTDATDDTLISGIFPKDKNLDVLKYKIKTLPYIPIEVIKNLDSDLVLDFLKYTITPINIHGFFISSSLTDWYEITDSWEIGKALSNQTGLVDRLYGSIYDDLSTLVTNIDNAKIIDMNILDYIFNNTTDYIILDGDRIIRKIVRDFVYRYRHTGDKNEYTKIINKLSNLFSYDENLFAIFSAYVDKFNDIYYDEQSDLDGSIPLPPYQMLE